MKLQLVNGEVVEVNPQRAKQLRKEGATVVNPQTTFERQNPRVRVMKAKAKKAKKTAKKAVVSEEG